MISAEEEKKRERQSRRETEEAQENVLSTASLGLCMSVCGYKANGID